MTNEPCNHTRNAPPPSGIQRGATITPLPRQPKRRRSRGAGEVVPFPAAAPPTPPAPPAPPVHSLPRTGAHGLLTMYYSVGPEEQAEMEAAVAAILRRYDARFGVRS